MLSRNPILVLLAPLALAGPARSQSFLQILDGAGDRVGAAGDVDGDGTQDIVVGRPYLEASSADEVGLVRVYSGATFALLHTFESTQPGAHFGHSVDGAGDVNGDGLDDLLVGAPLADTSEVDAGLVAVFSGRDGSVLLVAAGSIAGERMGHDVAGLGDIDGDGRGDFCVSAWGTSPATYVYSGASGTLLFEVPEFGESLDACGDIDGDGIGDLIAGSTDFEDGTGTFIGAAGVWSGATGDSLLFLPGVPPVPGIHRYGESVAGVGDADGDGVRDVAVANLGAAVFSPAGFEHVYSGVDGALLAELLPWGTFEEGARVAGIGDYDGDGLGDIYVAGDPRVFSLGVGSPIVHLDLPAIATLQPPSEQGTAAGLGDISGDGRDDFLVGLGANTYVLTGADVPPPGDDLEHHRLFRLETEHFFNTTVDLAGAGDVDGDGHADVLVGCGFTGPGFAGLVLVYSGSDGRLLQEIAGSAAGENLGVSVDGAGDVNGDGVPDLVAGASGPPNGAVRVFSGTDGALLHDIPGPLFSELGEVVAGAGDVNGDGRADFLASSTKLDFVKVFSGLDGSELLHLTSPPPVGNFFGEPALGVGDANGDGFDDVLVGTSSSGGGVPSFAAVFSGADGSLLHYLVAPLGSSFFAMSADGIGDLDGDGSDDFVIGSASSNFASPSAGAVHVFSGSDGALLRSWYGDSPGDRFGDTVSGLGDIDGDGWVDLAVGAPGDTTPDGATGSLQVISAHDGHVLEELGGQSLPGLGSELAGVGDIDGDGRADLATSALDGLFGSSNEIHVFSARPLDLASSEHELSVASGGTAELFIAAGSSRGGDTYLVLGSLSGTKPGLTLGFGTIPLQPDVYFFHSLTHPNATPLLDTLGVLDDAGEATARFELPAGTFAFLDGLLFHHAYLALDPATLAVQQIGQSTTPLTFVP